MGRTFRVRSDLRNEQTRAAHVCRGPAVSTRRDRGPRGNAEGSLPIVLLVGAFTGLVTSLQSVVAFSQFGLESFSGGATGKALSIELGPVLTSLMLSGRVGAGIATELGTMRITEQIDALESMA